MQCIVPIDIMNMCSTTSKTEIGLFPDSRIGNFWGHSCSSESTPIDSATDFNQFCCKFCTSENGIFIQAE